MAESVGPVFAGALTLDEINRALQELVERIDALRGLRGDVTIHDDLTVDTVKTQDSTGTTVHGIGTT